MTHEACILRLVSDPLTMIVVSKCLQNDGLETVGQALMIVVSCVVIILRKIYSE